MILATTLNLIAVMPTLPIRSMSPEPVVSHTPRQSAITEPSPLIIRALICAYAIKYNVDPAIAMAVARVESGNRKREFRVGLMGKTYYGPFGIHRCFLQKWPIDRLETNIEVGIRAIGRCRDLRKSLKRYNATFNETYYRAVLASARQYRRSGVGGDEK